LTLAAYLKWLVCLLLTRLSGYCVWDKDYIMCNSSILPGIAL